jgi:hypothetical protein
VIVVPPPRTGMALHFGIGITSADKDKIVVKCRRTNVI